jgi:glycine/D-amino acid oxidase-like deaminating enzyme
LTRFRADIAIIGGGLVGLAIANTLAQSRFGRIVLFERHQLGSGATGRSTATIDLFAQHAVPARLGLESYQVFTDFAQIYGEGCGFRTTGFLVLVGPTHRQGLVQFVHVCRSLGIDYQLLKPEELGDLEPLISAEGLAGAGYTPLGGYADPAMAVSALAKAARGSGVTIFENTPASIVAQADRVVAVDSPEGRIAVGSVINAAGPWAGEVAQTVFPDLPITPVRHDVGIMSGSLPREPLAFIDFTALTYARPETGGLILFGSLDPSLGNTPLAATDLQAAAPGFALLAAVAERLASRVPSSSQWRLRGGWSGIIDVTPDYHAIVDELPPGSGHWTVAGFSGHGFKIAPAIARLVAQMLEGNAPQDERQFYSYARFLQGRPHRPDLLPGVLG